MAENSGLNKFSFYVVATIAILYIVSMILSLIGISSRIVGLLQTIAAVCTIIVVAILAWRYVRNRTTIWRVFYFLCLALVIAGIVVPLVV